MGEGFPFSRRPGLLATRRFHATRVLRRGAKSALDQPDEAGPRSRSLRIPATIAEATRIVAALGTGIGSEDFSADNVR
jgi:hypothetical protein